ncbi:hypothetical protein LCGC14_2793810, partial [marine sediment metagenome]
MKKLLLTLVTVLFAVTMYAQSGFYKVKDYDGIIAYWIVNTNTSATSQAGFAAIKNADSLLILIDVDSAKITCTGSIEIAPDGDLIFVTSAGDIIGKVVDEKELKIGNAALDAYFIVAASATAGSEDIRVVNTNGTDEAAIAITSTAGGVDIDGAATKNVDIAGGQVLISSKDDVASAVAITTNVGVSETIVITNSAGTGAGAVELTSTLGGVDINAKEMLTLDVAAGTAGTTDIIITNTPGTDEAAIAIQAVAGGIDIDA